MDPVRTHAHHTDYADQTLAVIRSLLSETRSWPSSREITLDCSLQIDLGLDSLARFELLERIERHFGVTLPDNILLEMETPRDLVRELSRASAHSEDVIPLQVDVLPRDESTSFPEQARTLNEVLQWHVTTHPDRPHIQFYADTGDGTIVTYQSLHMGAQQVATGLQAQGIMPGEAVVIMLPTSEDYFYAFFGILLAGAIPVPIYPPTRPAQLEDHMRRHAAILKNCRAVLMITVSEAKKVALLLKSQVESLKFIVTVNELMAQQEQLVMPAVLANDTAFIQYTSGSTGNAKGVVLSHANLLANIRIMGKKINATGNDVFVSWLPLYHDMGLIGAWFGSMYYGILLVVMSPLAFLSRPQRWLQAIHRHRGTLSASPNFGYELCLHRLRDEDLQGLDLGSWRVAFNGAEPISPDTTQRFIQRFAGYGMSQNSMLPVYGLAENSLGLTFPLPGEPVRIDCIQRNIFMSSGKAVPTEAKDDSALRFVSCGQVLEDYEIRIADVAGNELPDRQQGRLQFKGPSATSGYLRNREATEKLFVGEWLDTGDQAYVSEGNLYVTGRNKDIIIRAGRNLYPHELEEVVGNLPQIRKGRVVVFGVADAKSGSERLVVLAESHERDETVHEQLRKKINEIVSDLIGGPADEILITRPGTVLKTSSGKLRRSACRELYQQGLLSQTSLPVWRQVYHLLLASIAPQTRRLYHRIRYLFWAEYARALFYFLAALAWLVVLLSPSQRLRWSVMRYATLTLAAMTGCQIRIEGRENLPDAGKACVYVANHASYLDGPLMTAALGRQFSFVAKAELKKQLIAGSFLKAIQTEFVERYDAVKSIEDAKRIARLAGGKRSFFFFPEGTFTRTAGLLPFHNGAFLIAAEAGLPVVPIVIRGTRSILRSDEPLPHQGSVTIRIGKPITLKQFSGPESETWNKAMFLRDKVRQYILHHCGEPDHGSY